MNASNQQMKLSFKNRVVSQVGKFNRKHKYLSFLGIIYALVAITTYNFLFYFYRNGKRFTALACILLFFVSSSSFSYPAMSLNISFASNSAVDDDVLGASRALSDEMVAESDAELVTETVDSTVLEQESSDINPDVAEIQSDNMATLNEILEGNVQSEQDEPGDSEDLIVDDLPTDAEDEVSFSSDDWKIVLVNKQHPIPENYYFDLGTISGNMRCDERIITPLLDMLKGARADGVNLIVCSPYRDMDRQTMLFTNKVERYMDSGLSYMDSYNLASQAVTVPGSSEHQIGLAVDIITDGYASLDEGFGDTAAGKWLAANSSKYGFILRYPKGKENITSIEYEPWHFRYVGVDAATVITDNDLCLEEFWNIYVD